MGRELKRVPLDFSHPQGVTWPGYTNEHYKECAVCHGSGQTGAKRTLESIVRLVMLAGSDAKRGRMHPYFSESPFWIGEVASPDMVALTTGLSGREPDEFMGHDSSDSWRATKAIIRAAGLDPDTWGICPACEGHGDDPETREAAEAWAPTEPPTGDGYQLWETTSEGSPVSPVFANLDDLCAWCEDGATTFGSAKATAAEWREMLDDGLVCHRKGNIVFM